MKHPITCLYFSTAELKPRLRAALLPGVLAIGLAGCGGQPAADTPTVPAATPSHADSTQAAPAAPAADATATDTARAQLAAPAKPVAKPKTVVKPATAPVAVEAAPVPEAAAEVAPTPAPVAAAEPVAPAAPTTRTQSGRVLDESGRPIIGATIMLKGSGKATTTDSNGNYTLEVPATANTFLFGYGGYEDETATAHDGQPLNVTLVPKAKSRR